VTGKAPRGPLGPGKFLFFDLRGSYMDVFTL
jgi:hypothetical protein